MSETYPQIPLTGFPSYPIEEMQKRATAFYETLRSRRTVREFSSRPVPLEIIQRCLETANTAPSGANRQPWHFAVVSSQGKKQEIRAAAEKEEQHFYHGGAPDEWVDAVQPLGTDEHKPFLEIAPHLIVIFAESVSVQAEEQTKNYYVNESVGIATGMLIASLHYSGLATLTHTPSPMRFLNKILDQPKHRRPFLILVTGYPSRDATVPNLPKKPLSEIATFL